MKITALLITGMLATTTLFGQLNWSPEYSVADGDTYGLNWPRIVISNGVPVVSFGDGLDEKFYVARWNGNGFGTPTEITVGGLGAYVQDWVGPGIAAQGDTVHVAFTSTPYYSGNIYIRSSYDGGMTFGDTVRVAQLDSGFAQLPGIAVDGFGNPVVMWMGHNDSGFDNKYMTAKSNDGGLTFGPAVDASSLAPGAEVCDCCPAEMTSKNGYTAVVFRDNNNNLRDFYASVSTNGGAAYTAAYDIDSTDWTINGCPSSGPDVMISGNTLTSVFGSGATVPQRVYLSQVDLTSGSITTNSQLFTTPTPSQAANFKPRIDGNGDTLGIIWEQNRQGQLEVVFAHTTTGPSGIPLTTYDSVAVSSQGQQKMPDVAYHNRTFYFVWSDYETGDVRFRYASFDAIPAGVADEDVIADFNVFPNPAQDILYLDVEGSGAGVIEVSIHHINGKLVSTAQISTTADGIDISRLPAGVYMVNCTIDGYVHTRKFIKL